VKNYSSSQLCPVQVNGKYGIIKLINWKRYLSWARC
jgi:hypothetical protein